MSSESKTVKVLLVASRPQITKRIGLRMLTTLQLSLWFPTVLLIDLGL